MSRPKALSKTTRSLIESLTADHWNRFQTKHVELPERYIVGLRGNTTSGPREWNDVMFYISPDIFLAEHANTDQSRCGWNAGDGEPMAVLDAGCWPFIRGPHDGGAPVFRQMTRQDAVKVDAPFDGRFAVTRCYAANDARNYMEAGYYDINICPSGTSSKGCQILPADHAQAFLQAVWDDTLAAKMPFVWYILIEGPIV
jgi:hypothetical protein